MRTRTLCAGQTVAGEPCRQVRIGVEPPWYCHAHKAQDGKKRIVTAVVPEWVKPEYDPEYDPEYAATHAGADS